MGDGRWRGWVPSADAPGHLVDCQRQGGTGKREERGLVVSLRAQPRGPLPWRSVPPARPPLYCTQYSTVHVLRPVLSSGFVT